MEEKSSLEVIRTTEIDSQSDEAAGQGVRCVQPEAPAEAALGTSWRLVSRLLRPWDFPGKSTGVGCHRLLRAPHSACAVSLPPPRSLSQTIPRPEATLAF